MLNVLWHSNSAASPSGYGNQTALFTRRLQAAGYPTVISAFFGAEGSAYLNADGLLTLPRGVNPYGNDILHGHLHHPHWPNGTPGDLVVSLIDPFVLDPAIWAEVPWCAWVPVDSAPVFSGNVRSLKAARWIWAMSRFGEEQLRAAGFDPIYVPHGVDSAVYHPADRTEARKALGTYLNRDLTDKFLIVSVAANKGTPSRKNFVSMIEAFALFVKGSPELGIAPHPDALFYLHTEPRGVWGGEDIRAIAEAFGVGDQVLLPVQYHVVAGLLGHEFVNNAYNAGDVFLLLSSEGFGIPIVEAQMAGCPVIVSDFSACPELCFAGWTVLGQRQYVPATGVFWYEPVILEAARTLACAYEARGDQALRQQARAGAMAYDADHVFATYMLPALRRIADELRPDPVLSSADRAVLHLGCGVRPLKNAVNHDRTRHADFVDIAHDLDLLPWPWADASFDRIVALDVLEHLKTDVQTWLNECWRILKPGGELFMRLPAHDNPVSYRDTTHQRFFHEESFDYWDPKKALFANYGHFYYAEPGKPSATGRWWDVISVARVNPDARYGVGDLQFRLRKRPTEDLPPANHSVAASSSPSLAELASSSPLLAQRGRGAGGEGKDSTHAA